MKNKFIILLSFLLIIFLAGCSKYEKDMSVDTELYGSYYTNIKSTNSNYLLSETYTFNEDNTYVYSVKEVINSKITKDNTLSGDISVEELSTNITKITTSLNNKIYKYKNMLGSFYECTVPKDKTFDFKYNNITFWFDNDGQYHLCTNTTECNCDTNCPQYIRKDNIIYFQSMDKKHKNTYTIGAYIVDKGLFFPELYKQ